MKYSIHTDLKFKPLEIVDTAALARKCGETWWNQSLCLVNGCVVRVGVFKGKFHWHKHVKEDEYFHVLSGYLLLDLKGRTVKLSKGLGIMVPRGVLHRTRAPKRTVVLMIEAAGVRPEGD